MAKSSIESLLETLHGDLHQVIPQMVTEKGQEEAAQILKVKQSWLSRWLRENGYRRIVQWVREPVKES